VANSLDWLSAGTDICDDTLIYCDPPYLLGTRRIQDRPIYRYELCDDDHRRLLGILTQLRCKVMLSGYPSDMYDNALKGWRRITYYAMTRGGSMAQEVIWCNFPEPWELHDYRFLGKNFRERERIKRKIHRWQDRLTRMDATERAALIQALQQVCYPVPAVT
jgi:DNA adenine methylase